MNAKLTKDDIQLIRQLKESGITMAEIARKFEVSRSAIQDIFSEWGEDNMNAKLTKDDIQLIRQLKESGITMAEIARKFEVSRSTIQDIFSGRSWRNL